MENPARTTTLEVVKKSKDVKINREKIKEIAKEWAAGDLQVPDWPREYHLKTENQQQMLDYLLLLDA